MSAEIRRLIERWRERASDWMDDGSSQMRGEGATVLELLDELDALLTAAPAPHSEIRRLLEEEITKHLDALDRESYGVDVREKFDSQRPVIATVVDRNAALHYLLFIRKRVRDLLTAAPAAPQEARGWQPIETAPKEQRVLVLLKPHPFQDAGEITFGYFVMTLPDQPAGVWTGDETGEAIVPTHWLPLPSPPVVREERTP